VVDRTGELIGCARMDGRAPRFLKAAHRKAYTAAVFEMDTNGVMKFWKRQEDDGHRGPADWNDPMLTTLPGGLCVVHDGKVVGAIAVSGGGSTGSSGGTSDWDFAEVAFQALGQVSATLMSCIRTGRCMSTLSELFLGDDPIPVGSAWESLSTRYVSMESMLGQR